MSDLKYLAEQLQLSKTTVSWVLAGKGDEKMISKTTQKRVIDFANKVNYRTNLLAKSLSTGCTNTIGLILPSIGDHFYSELAKTIEIEAEKHNYTITFCSSLADTEREKRLVDMLMAKKVDGLIMAPTAGSIDLIKSIQDDGFPLVLVNRFFPSLSTNSVTIDNYRTAYNLVKALIDYRQSRKIVMVTTSDSFAAMDLRHKGYCDALSDAGLVIDKNLIIKVSRDDYKNELKDKFDKFLKQGNEVDGCFFATQFLAIESIRYFKRNQISIEDGEKWACIDNNDIFELIAPKMIIAKQCVEDIGRYSIETLLGVLKGGTEQVKNIIVSTNIASLGGV